MASWEGISYLVQPDSSCNATRSALISRASLSSASVSANDFAMQAPGAGVQMFPSSQSFLANGTSVSSSIDGTSAYSILHALHIMLEHSLEAAMK